MTSHNPEAYRLSERKARRIVNYHPDIMFEWLSGASSENIAQRFLTEGDSLSLVSSAVCRALRELIPADIMNDRKRRVAGWLYSAGKGLAALTEAERADGNRKSVEARGMGLMMLKDKLLMGT